MPSVKTHSFKHKVLVLILISVVFLYNREYIEFALYYKYACLNAAVDVGNGQELGACGWKVLNDLPDAPDIREFVYDTGDQLLLPEKDRSEMWQKKAEKFGLRETFIIQNPDTKTKKWVVKDKFGGVIYLGKHFYRVSL